MSNAIYAMLGRQQGLMQEMQVVANNLANSSTTGYKSDRALFGEFLVATGSQSSSLSMGGLAGHSFAMAQGALKITGGEMDLAIQGDGFFPGRYGARTTPDPRWPFPAVYGRSTGRHERQRRSEFRRDTNQYSSECEPDSCFSGWDE
jgi:flagellar hook protein FlgE